MKTDRKTPQTEVDMQQGIAGARAQLDRDKDGTELVGSRMGRLDPDNFKNQGPSDNEDTDSDKRMDSEAINDDFNDSYRVKGDTSHDRDDNYYLGSSTARTSGL
ncbi:hypothetical protein GCM10023187_56460 [Nibrella viscosa]|uniref:Uncharacterized protein n=1 Tax=Nibrella viscosa TaxID=1084524 RepID=A0ABP8L3J3_9BACT